MNKLAYILILPFLVLSLPGNAQSGQQSSAAETMDSATLKQVMPKLNFKPSPVVGKDYYYQSLGLACKLEFRMEKAIKVPLRVRLGSLQQTDYLERKPNVQKPQ